MKYHERHERQDLLDSTAAASKLCTGCSMAVSSFCATISDCFPRRCLEEKVLGKGGGPKGFSGSCRGSLSPCSFSQNMTFHVFPCFSSCFLMFSPVIVLLVETGILVPRPLESPRDLARLEASTASADFVEQRLVPLVFASVPLH